jgi:hypothetical protein
MIIISPAQSFVDFNGTPVDCKGFEVDVALPAYANFGIKFQFSVLDELVPTSTIFKAAICNADCETIYNPDYEVIHICNRFTLNLSGTIISDEDFPIYIPTYTPAPYQPLIPSGFYDRAGLMTAISDAYEYALPGFDFIDCCASEVPTISGIDAQIHGEGSVLELRLSTFFASGYVDFPTTSMDGYIGVEECFRYCIMSEADEGGMILGCSNLFKRIFDPCYTTVFNYYNEENSYGFKYIVYAPNQITENQIRLFVNFGKPLYNINENIFRQSNEVQKRLSTNISRTWAGNVSYMSDDQHLKLVILLKSDYLFVQHMNKNIDRRMIQIGEYTPEFTEGQHVNDPYPASFNILDFPNAYTNNNCGFNCGVEVLDSCTIIISPGGNVSKYKIEFTIPTGDMAIGATTYTNSNFIGAADVEVYREGLIQYLSGTNYYSFDTLTGEITVFPEVVAGERFSIWAI